MSGASITVRGGTDGITANTDELRTAAAVFDDVGDQVAALLAGLVAVLPDTSPACALADPAGYRRLSEDLTTITQGPQSLGRSAGDCRGLSAAMRRAADGYERADRLGRLAGVDPADVLIRMLAPLGPGQVTAPLAALYPDGHARVRPLGVDAGADSGGPPRSLADVITGLQRRDRGAGGEIDVRILTTTEPDGRTTRRVIVDIPGTTDWSMRPLNPTVTDMASNMHAMQGDATTYGEGVIRALENACVGPGEAIMLVGHSLGGIVAVGLANQLARSGRFTVTHVVTAGSPVASLPVPASVSLLAMEGSDDLVPKLDGRANPDRTNRVTVEIDQPGHHVVGNHSISGVYLPEARMIDASDDRSIRGYLASASGFLDADSVTTYRYVVTRD